MDDLKTSCGAFTMNKITYRYILETLIIACFHDLIKLKYTWICIDCTWIPTGVQGLMTAIKQGQ